MSDAVHTLMEMGFTAAQAQEALSATGNDLTKAIAFLFGEVEEPQGSGTEQLPFAVDPQPASYGTVSVKNPQDVPEFLSQYASSEAIEGPGYDTKYDEYNNSSFDSLPVKPAEEPRETQPLLGDDIGNLELEKASLEDIYGPNVKGEQTVPVVVAESAAARCWVPLIHILAYFPPFVRAVLENEYELPFMRELQRLVYFVQHFELSKRWYISADALALHLPAEFQSSFYMDEEAVLSMVELLMLSAPALRPIFESLVESVDEGISKDLTVLEIDLDQPGRTLYEKLNELFWQQGFAKLGCVKYSLVAPAVSYQLVGEEYAYAAPFELQETMYPEIYSDVALELVQAQVDEMHAAEGELREATRQLMDLNFFEGKRLDSLLRQSARAVSGASAGADLLALAGQLDSVRAREVAQQAQLKAQALPQQLAQFERVVAQVPQLQPYVLYGVIVSERRYYVRVHDTWLRMDDAVAVDFDQVREDVQDVSRRGPHLITLMYGASKSGLESATGAANGANASTDSGAAEISAIDADNAASPTAGSGDANLIDLDTTDGATGPVQGAAGAEHSRDGSNETVPPAASSRVPDSAEAAELVKRRKWDACEDEPITAAAYVVDQFTSDELAAR